MSQGDPQLDKGRQLYCCRPPACGREFNSQVCLSDLFPEDGTLYKGAKLGECRLKALELEPMPELGLNMKAQLLLTTDMAMVPVLTIPR